MVEPARPAVHEQLVTELPAFEVIDGVGVFRPQATCHFRQATSLVRQGILHAKALGLGLLMVNTTRLQGFKSPSVAARVEMAREWSEAADGQLSMAVVVRREFIDPEKIGVIAAARFGAKANVFESEADAMAWLHEN